MSAAEWLERYARAVGPGRWRDLSAFRQAARELDWTLHETGEPSFDAILESMGADAFDSSFIDPFTTPAAVCEACGRTAVDTTGWGVHPCLCPDCWRRAAA